VADFGIAKSRGGRTNLSTRNVHAGTPAYMVRASAQPSHRLRKLLLMYPCTLPPGTTAIPSIAQLWPFVTTLVGAGRDCDHPVLVTFATSLPEA
jgi:hypothetical protein